MKAVAVQGETIDKVVAATRGHALFKSLGDDQLRQAVSQASLVQLDAGENLIQRGAPLDGFFLILDGELRVLMDAEAGGDPVEVTRFGRGEMLGMASLLLGRPSDAAMEAAVRSTVARFEPRFFEVMVEKVPSFGLAVARSLAERMAMLSEMRIPVPEADGKLEPSEEALVLLPHDFMVRHRVVPLAVEGSGRHYRLCGSTVRRTHREDPDPPAGHGGPHRSPRRPPALRDTQDPCRW